jgi:hypothetical protein
MNPINRRVTPSLFEHPRLSKVDLSRCQGHEKHLDDSVVVLVMVSAADQADVLQG